MFLPTNNYVVSILTILQNEIRTELLFFIDGYEDLASYFHGELLCHYLGRKNNRSQNRQRLLFIFLRSVRTQHDKLEN